MKRLVILSFQYYRLLLLYNVAFSIIGLFISIMGSGIGTEAFVMAKLVGYFSSVGLYHFSAKQSYLYFRNAGYTMQPIIISAWLLDMLVFLILFTLGLLIKLCVH